MRAASRPSRRCGPGRRDTRRPPTELGPLRESRESWPVDSSDDSRHLEERPAAGLRRARQRLGPVETRLDLVWPIGGESRDAVGGWRDAGGNDLLDLVGVGEDVAKLLPEQVG